MGLLDILNGMQNGPRGQTTPAPAGSGGMSPIAMALLRNALNTGADSIDAACQTEMTYQSTLQNSEDFGEAAKAFLEKRPPRFTGR